MVAATDLVRIRRGDSGFSATLQQLFDYINGGTSAVAPANTNSANPRFPNYAALTDTDYLVLWDGSGNPRPFTLVAFKVYVAGGLALSNLVASNTGFPKLGPIDGSWALKIATISGVTYSASFDSVIAAISPHPAVASYTGQVATRCFWPKAVTAGVTAQDQITAHVMRENANSLQFEYPAVYVDSDVDGAVKTTGSYTLTMTVEQPLGTVIGNLTYTVTGGTTRLSSARALTKTVLAGSVIFLRSNIVCASGQFPICNHGNVNSQQWREMGETPAALYPTAILATTTKPSLMILLNSRHAGFGAQPNINGDVGEIASAYGGQFAWVCVAVPSDLAYWFVRNRQMRMVTGGYVTHILIGGPGDMRATDIQASTPAQTMADVQNIARLFPTKAIGLTTTTPRPTSVTDPGAYNTPRVQYNALAMAKPSPFVGAFDVATLPGFDPGNDGQWDNPAYVNSDLTHETLAGYQAIVDSGIMLRSFMQAAPIAQPWSPFSLFPTTSTKGLWYDVNDPTCVGRAAFGQSKSNSAGFTQASAPAQPTTVNNAIGTKSALKFTLANSQELTGGTTFKATLQNEAGALLAALVIPGVTAATSRTLIKLSVGTSTANTRAGISIITGNFVQCTYRRLDADAINTLVGTTALDANTPYFIVAYIDVAGPAGNVITRINGSPEATQATGGADGNFSNTASQAASIGSGGGGTYFDGHMAEWLVSPGQYTLANIQKLEGEIMWRYGLQASLPVDHPYKAGPPLN